MKQQLLQWNSKNQGLIVAARLIFDLFQKHKIKISELLLLQNQTYNKLEAAELELFQNTNSSIFEKHRTKFEERDKERFEKLYKQCLALDEFGVKPKLIQKRLNITTVTDYQSIYNAVRKYLKTLSLDNQIHINVFSWHATNAHHLVDA